MLRIGIIFIYAYFVSAVLSLHLPPAVTFLTIFFVGVLAWIVIKIFNHPAAYTIDFSGSLKEEGVTLPDGQVVTIRWGNITAIPGDPNFTHHYLTVEQTINSENVHGKKEVRYLHCKAYVISIHVAPEVIKANFFEPYAQDLITGVIPLNGEQPPWTTAPP